MLREMSLDDWSQAEALARAYLKTEKNAVEPISFRWFENTPFLVAGWWPGNGGVRVLVYDGKVQTARGMAALPGYFEFLGADRLRALPVGSLDNVLYTFGVSAPDRSEVGPPWRKGVEDYQDLFPVITEHDGVLEYVVHYVEVDPPLPSGMGGSKAPGPLVLQRWSLQLFPVRPDLDWEMQGKIERPNPPLKLV